MALLQGNQGQIGKQTGQNLTVGFGESSEVLVTELMPRYYENTYRGQKFSVQFPVTALAVAAAASSLVIINPTGSGKNLVFMDAYTSFIAITASAIGTSVVLGFAANGALGTVGTVVVPVNNLLGSGNTSVAKCYLTATLNAAPVAARQLASLYGDLAASDQSGVHDDVSGALVLTPGYAVAIFGLGGTPANITVQPSLTWDEVAI